MNNVAFFDLDNTLIHGSSMFHLARVALRRRLVTRMQMVRFTLGEMRYVVTREESLRSRQLLTCRALSVVQGRTEVEVRQLGIEAATWLTSNRLVGVTLRQLYMHQSRGDACWLVTASAREVAEPLAQFLGMTGVLSTRAEIREGIYTGRLDAGAMHGEAKAAAVRELALRLSVPLELAHAYSDSSNDIPMLEQVGSACVVNASRRFEREARRRGWVVLRAMQPRPTASRRLHPNWADALRREMQLQAHVSIPRRAMDFAAICL